MSKDIKKYIKNLIDSVDVKSRSQSEYEYEIKQLQEEVKKLNFTVKEQKLLIQEQEKKLENAENTDLPSDIKILKDIIIAQRQELKKKEKDIEILEQKIDELNTKTLEKSPQANNLILGEELVNAKKLIVQLTKETETYKQNEINSQNHVEKLTKETEASRLENDNLKIKIQNLESELNKKISSMIKSDESSLMIEKSVEKKSNIEVFEREINRLKSEFEIDDITSEDPLKSLDFMINKMLLIKSENKELKTIFDNASIKIKKLESETNNLLLKNSEQSNQIILREEKIQNLNKEIEKLNKENIEKNGVIQELSNKLEVQNKENFVAQNSTTRHSDEIIEQLTKENIGLKNIVLKLRENKSDSPTDIKINDLLYKELEENSKRLKEENVRLNNSISELKKTLSESKTQTKIEFQANRYVPKSYQKIIFIRLFNVLDKIKREIIIESLIQDLINVESSSDVKRYIVDILSEFKEEKKVCDTLIEIVNKEDWITKLYIIKALSNFDRNIVKNVLEKLCKDADFDVREAARRFLGNISNELF